MLSAVNIFMTVTKFKSWRVYVGKEGRESTQMFKVASSCHPVTWAQKKVTKINF